ncbi:hypothetical protein CLV01_4123 [Delftia sp. 60]|nr:hypothetical protein CLU98_2326 [Burkholderiales bacterium 23]PIF67707.1 hypothetical protein CLV01_4123 [Delftia sp. 60]
MQDLQAGSPHGPCVWGRPGERFNTWSHLRNGVRRRCAQDCGRCGVWPVSGGAVWRIGPLSWLYRGAQAFLAARRPRLHLPADCRQPHALCLDGAPWLVGLAAAWRRMGARIPGCDTCTGFRFAAAPVPVHQPWLAQLGGRGAGGLSPWCADPGLAARRRTALFGRNGVLPSSGEHAPRARHLASVRGCRQRLPYRCGSRFARLTACHSWLRHPAGRFLAHSIAERSRGCQHQRVHKHFVWAAILDPLWPQ